MALPLAPPKALLSRGPSPSSAAAACGPSQPAAPGPFSSSLGPASRRRPARPGPARPPSRAALNAGIPGRVAERPGKLPAMPGGAGLSERGCQRRAGRDPGAEGPRARGRGRGRLAAVLPSASPQCPRLERRVGACRLLAVRAAAEGGGETEARVPRCVRARPWPLRPSCQLWRLPTLWRVPSPSNACEVRRPDGERQPICSLYTESPGLFPATYVLALLPEKSLWPIYRDPELYILDMYQALGHDWDWGMGFAQPQLLSVTIFHSVHKPQHVPGTGLIPITYQLLIKEEQSLLA